MTHDADSNRTRRFAAALVETDLLLGLDAVPIDGPARESLGDPGPGAPERAGESPPTPQPTPQPVTPRARREPAPSPAVRVTAPGPTTSSPASPLDPAIAAGTLDASSPTATLDAIREHHAAHCPLCTTATDTRSIVFGEGDPTADLVFVGEAPGEQEDRAGRPFVGPAGELLDKMIAALGLDRGDVYITNVVKTRPRENRTPRPDEAAVCGAWLANELLAIRPKAIVALGGTPAKHLLQTKTGITRLRGVWGGCRIGDLALPVMPTFHPAFVLRQYTTEVRSAVWQDLQAARARVDG